MRAPLERYCPLISDAKGAARSCPAGSIAEVGLRWCGATPRNRTEDLKCQSLQRSDRWRQRQPPFQLQNHRDTVLAILSLRGPIAARSNRASSPCCNGFQYDCSAGELACCNHRKPLRKDLLSVRLTSQLEGCAFAPRGNGTWAFESS